MGASLMVHGQIEPIVVKPADSEGLYEGVVGRLRFEGIKHARLQSVLIRIHKFEGEGEVLEWQLAENLHRKELSALERAQAYGKLAELRRRSFREETVVEGISMSIEALTGTRPASETVRKYLQINARIRNKARNAYPRVSSEKACFPKLKHLEQLCRVQDEERQAHLLGRVIAEGWTVAKLRQQVDLELGIVKPKPAAKPEACQTVTCQTCRASLILVHVEDGTHKILVKQRKV